MAVQGPEARKLIQQDVDFDLSSMKPFDVAHNVSYLGKTIMLIDERSKSTSCCISFLASGPCTANCPYWFETFSTSTSKSLAWDLIQSKSLSVLAALTTNKNVSWSSL